MRKYQFLALIEQMIEEEGYKYFRVSIDTVDLRPPQGKVDLYLEATKTKSDMDKEKKIKKIYLKTTTVGKTKMIKHVYINMIEQYDSSRSTKPIYYKFKVNN